jgi:ribonuclease T1
VLKIDRLVPRLVHAPTRTFALALAASLTLLSASPAEAFTRQGTPTTEQAQQDQVVALSKLPVQAREVHRLIHEGGPFRYNKDGTVFGNRERLLPRRARGFYREYTVPTPGERDRGARRIVCGGKEVKQPETCFYTRDHYASFQLIDPRR